MIFLLSAIKTYLIKKFKVSYINTYKYTIECVYSILLLIIFKTHIINFKFFSYYPAIIWTLWDISLSTPMLPTPACSHRLPCDQVPGNEKELQMWRLPGWLLQSWPQGQMQLTAVSPYLVLLSLGGCNAYRVITFIWQRGKK